MTILPRMLDKTRDSSYLSLCPETPRRRKPAMLCLLSYRRRLKEARTSHDLHKDAFENFFFELYCYGVLKIVRNID